MAGKSLGTLTIDLVAKVGGFVSGMDKAERASAKWSKQVQDDVAKSSAALAGIGAAAIAAGLAVGASGFQLLKSTSRQIAETDRWAKSLQLSTQELLAWQFAAEKAGVSGDQMADIFKDIGDKIGDAVLNKSGEAVDALNALGLSAEKLSKVSPDKQLLAIGESLGKISTNAEKTTILESLGNDLSKLLPLFDNNNQKLKQFIDLAKDYGVAPDPSSIDDLVKVNQLFEDMEAQVAGLKIEIAAGLAKVDLTPLQGSLDKLHDVLTDPLVLQGISDLVSEVAQLAGWLVKAAAGAGQLAASTGNRFAALSGKIDLTNIDQVNERIEYLQKILEGKKGFYSQSESMFGWITGVDDSAKALNDELQSLIETRDKFSKASKSVLPLQVATVGTDNPFSLPPGGTNGKPVKTPTSKTENAFNSRLLDLQKQAALIETTGKKTAEVTELEKINFDITSGNLKKLSEAQKEQLRTAAKVLDSKKEELRLNKENARVAEYVSGLEKQNKLVRQGFDNQIVGRYSGSRERSRMQDNNDIQQDFASRQDDLLNQLQSGDIDQSLYDKKKEALQNSLDERLKIQEEYYKKQDELQNDGAAGFISGLATQIEASMDLYTNMQQVGAQAFSTLTDMIINWAETGKLNVKDFAATFLQSVGSTLLSYAAAQVAMAGLQAFTAMIGVPFVGPEIAGPAAIAATAAAGVLAIGVGTALQGQAHDGIDSVPETGTWLLQKGERVTTAKTSAKLDATLDRVANQSTGGATYAPSMSFYVNGDPSDAQIAMMKKAASEGAQMGYQKAVQSIATGQGDLHRALMGKTTSGRKIS
ncbi:phage tail tape measure protein [Klebsiella quasipneumoniae]|uniref:phage tail tape measure protein n=1 Tax=Klebsiella quasipneumoniae TaxID=1463165 RepID=UPI00284DE912|nr:phage tail tape measure protein [Klebsiella quasipneumoniae]MDR4696341.1 phage tail tape measure protein [Klebsiella quasipneumoniae]MDR4800140.1 phage tail tape measure protein [Klebsiella quasipneumoniae]MDR4837041.1 phage tail tape measure protein [Klebsiella quasipneumoniae]MDR4873595.1 phage tail tape measure protein [Klebsiella quasipneumoniae]